MNKKYVTVIIAIAAILIVIGMIFVNSGSSATINVVGSTSVQPVAEKLSETYKASHPDVKINVQGGGSGVGIKSVAEGTSDIGTSSKSLKADEKKGLTEYTLGQDGIVVAINTKNAASDLTKDQLKDIFSGKITNWKEIGGSDASINLITREEGSGTLDAFEKLVMGDDKIKSSAIVQSSTEAVKQSVKQDPNAIGFVSFAAMSDDVKAIKVGGVSPSEETIADGTYELQRPFLFLVKGEAKGEVKAFIDWVMGTEGSKILADEKIIKAKK
ncbi:phosphate ABC transporter substrate-binding protein [Methanobrevibacter filiformis]|uniref:Phosphate-binding protein PstS 1 n=1 Tax=Methanobrevibacter filiformis TaxID=55758 RepID=A0A166FDG2_9EURY|nr:phosphate ABC transporter substrate-binding protein [Methanobrevibacter filiformis]KZX17563.1 phosphate-binding protein PstS 1 precursor [Methanobrevibacter filiformis]